MQTPPDSVWNEPAFASAPRGEPAAARALADEPALGAAPRAADAAHEVWSEPALAPHLRPPDPAATAAGRRRAAWAEADPLLAWLAALALAAAAGPFAVLAAFLKTSSTSFVLAAVVVGPLVEELGKAAAPLMALERRPSLFTSGAQLVLACAAAGLVFAVIENLLYLHLYVREPTAAFARWRWTVCTALHVGCSLIGGLGLRRSWLAARAARGPAEVADAAPHLIAAMALHGAYNALALLLQGTGALSFKS